MENQGSLNAITAMMRDKTPIELGCERKDEDRKGRLRGKRTRKARCCTPDLSRLPYQSITTFVLALFSTLLSCWIRTCFCEYLFRRLSLFLTFQSTWYMWAFTWSFDWITITPCDAVFFPPTSPALGIHCRHWVSLSLRLHKRPFLWCTVWLFSCL